MWRAYDIVTIAFGVFGVCGVWVAVMGLYLTVTNRERAADICRQCYDKGIIGYFAVREPRWWRYLYKYQTTPHKVPSVQYLIEAGERLRYTSSAFDHMEPSVSPSRTSWSNFYETIFNEIAQQPPEVIEQEQRVSSAVGDILDKVKQRVKDTPSARRALYKPDGIQGPSLINCVIPLPHFMVRGRVPRVTIMDKLLWIIGWTPCIEITREELTALAVILGMKLRLNDGFASTLLKGEGAYATSFTALLSPNNPQWKFSLNVTHRYRRHFASMGSGYSILHALFLASGSIPFGREISGTHQMLVKCIHISAEVLKAVEEGRNIFETLTPAASDIPAIEWHSRLPGSRGYFYLGVEEGVEEGIGLIKDSDHNVITDQNALWWVAVTRIAFGGLVPRTTSNVKDAVLFTVTGLRRNEETGESLKQLGKDLRGRLEQLIIALQRYLPNLGRCVFGTYVEHDLAVHPPENFVGKAIPCLNVRDATAIFGHYMTLLERLTALCDININGNADADDDNDNDNNNNNINGAPEENPIRDDKLNAVFSATCRYLERTYRQAVSHDTSAQDLCQRLEKIWRRIVKDGRESTITVDDCKIVVRCILAAWALSVFIIKPGIYNHESEEYQTETADGEIDNPCLWVLPDVVAFA